MKQDDLSKDQAAVLAKTVGGYLAYLFRLRKRMTQVGFPDTDPLYRLVDKTYDATHRLWIDLHYKSCGIGGMIARHTPTREPGESGK